MKTNVFITIDTEHSIGGALRGQGLAPVGNARAIFGKIDGMLYGIPQIMDIAEQYGLRLTFFLEVFNHNHFGQGASREACEYILQRNHDVQLHLHPAYLNFSLPDPSTKKYSDLIGSYDLATQIEFCEEGRILLQEYGAPSPNAFRAGCYGANTDTLLALARTGFILDCSYNPAYVGRSCLLPNWGLNDLAEKEGVFELPVTSFIEQTGLRARRCMPLDINGVSFEEMRYVLECCKNGEGPRHVAVILHSFSFVKPRDVQYARMTPRRHVIRRFEKLCRFLAENADDFHVRTFDTLTRDELAAMARERRDDFPVVPAHLSVARFGGQLWDRVM